ncbi:MULTISPECIES: hypothetical protein [unclassified Streptomyces]|uniref:hypothetical protein n=1 Tax=unclassified Streptomyces TaxID=2593676 RepID=UPI001EF9B61C|nr:MULTISPECIES: hypothetical protein [unclassified Streptomyces]
MPLAPVVDQGVRLPLADQLAQFPVAPLVLGVLELPVQPDDVEIAVRGEQLVELSLSEWDQVIADFKAKGGAKAAESLAKEYEAAR